MDTTNIKQEEKTKPRKSWQRELLEWGLAILAAVVIAFLVRAYVFSPYRVDGVSMLETLQDGEMMFTTKYDYILGEPSRFDVVICRYPGRSEHFVKRLVGLPGDTVAIAGGVLYVNGEAQEEAYITHLPNYTMEAYTLAEDEYFVLGDNRSNSNDSHIIGTLARSQIEAHVRAVYYPFSSIRAIH